jgi:hypothetical protein
MSLGLSRGVRLVVACSMGSVAMWMGGCSTVLGIGDWTGLTSDGGTTSTPGSSSGLGNGSSGSSPSTSSSTSGVSGRSSTSTGASSSTSSVCTPAAAQCVGNQPQRCIDGAWQDDGNPCSGATPACLTGSCVACTPGQNQCVGPQAQYCDGTGTWQDPGGSSVICPGAAGCDGGFCVCSATVVPGAFATSPGTVGQGGMQTTIGLGGYSYAYSDATANGCGTAPTSICVDAEAVCVSGTTGMQSTDCYGGGFGVEVQGEGASSTGYAVPSSSTGVTYSLSEFPTYVGSMMIAVYLGANGGSGGTSYCSIISAASGTVPWTSFEQNCYATPPGPALTGPPTNLFRVQFQINDGLNPTNFNFCLTGLAFSD